MLPSHEVQRQASKPNAMKALLDAYEDEGKDLEKEMGALLCGAVLFLKCIILTCVRVYKCHTGRAEIREPSVEAGSLLPCGSWDQVQAIRFSGKHLYPLIRPAGLLCLLY